VPFCGESFAVACLKTYHVAPPGKARWTLAESVLCNRAPVLTLWGAVVAERLGHDRDAALTLGKCLSGLNAQSKGRRLGIFGPPKGPEGQPTRKAGLGEEFWVELCGRGLPCKNTPQGVRAVIGQDPIDPATVQRYLEQKFGQDLPRVRSAMERLAKALEPAELAGQAFGLYEQFRPQIPPGRAGWGAKGVLDLDLIRSLAGE